MGVDLSSCVAAGNRIRRTFVATLLHRLVQQDVATLLSDLDYPEFRQAVEQLLAAEAFFALRHRLRCELSFEQVTPAVAVIE